MKRTITVFVVASCLAPVASLGQSTSADFQRRQREMKAKHERRVAEMKMKLRSPQSKRTGPPTSSRPRTTASPASRSRPETKPTFNPASAPSPVACLDAFRTAARNATTMDAMLKYLPASRARALQDSKANYDPKDVPRKRKWFQQSNPKLDEESLTYLTNSPYVNALERNKRIAENILEVLSVDVKENQAFIKVSTTVGATVNGTEFPYGTAEIEMLGEGNYWKFSSYNDNNVVYLHPPTR